MSRLAPLILCALLACGPPTPSGREAPPAAPEARILPEEKHFADLRQLTYGGENAEAYWSFDGKELIFQSRPTGESCDQIFRMPLADPKAVRRVSTGEGVTTCSYFMPNEDAFIYASTHLAAPGCPPRPDHSQGYVWPLYAGYDIFKSQAGASDLARLTDTPGYDAEATVCRKDGSIVFTSVRDGDLELYRMDADGANVKRLTHTPGYDGGAFFNADCSKIVWRASRPRGDALADYQRLLKQGLVRPTKLELFVANADGSDARQITYLDAASFGPYWHPNGERIVFSTNYPNPRGREFDLWAIDSDGTDLERITFAEGFDGFPMFSPDGKTLAFSSNRATAPGAGDTNVFLVTWKDEAGTPTPTAADRVHADVAWLAAPEREGRGLGTAGLEEAGAYIEKRFAEEGLTSPARQSFEVTTRVEVGESTAVTLDGKNLADGLFRPATGSASDTVSGPLIFAGYGAEGDYAGIDAKDKIVVVRRFAADALSAADKRRFSDLRYKAFTAKQNGAKGLIVVDAPPAGITAHEAPFPALRADGQSDAGIPIVLVKRDAAAPVIQKLEKRQRVTASLSVALEKKKTKAFNVIGKLAATAPDSDGAIVIGAHYDHLGMGGESSLAPDEVKAHLGADDNASGIAALLEVARLLGKEKERSRDVWFVAFSAEEAGVIGSTHFVRDPPAGVALKDMVAMLNMDMVGRLRENRLSVLGGATALEWPKLVSEACDGARIDCITTGGGFGRSDQTAFYASGVPVLHFFTGAHEDYHKPSDTLDRINAAGIAQIARVVADVATKVSARAERLGYQRVASPPPPGDLRGYGASLGTVPNYVGPADGRDGMLLDGVRPGGPADLAGMKRGDILIKLGAFDIANVRDLMYALNASRPGETVKATVIRGGDELVLDVTFGKSTRR